MNLRILKIDLAMAKAGYGKQVEKWAHERLMKEVAAFQPGIAGRLLRGCRG